MFLHGVSSSVNSWRNLVVGGRAVVLATLCFGLALACSNSDKPKPPIHQGGAPDAGAQGAPDAGEATAAGGAGGADNTGSGAVGGAPDVIGTAGASNEPGTWDDSFWDDAVWQ